MIPFLSPTGTTPRPSSLSICSCRYACRVHYMRASSTPAHCRVVGCDDEDCSHHTHRRTQAYTLTHTCTRTDTHMYTHKHTCTHTNTHINTHRNTLVSTLTHACIHTHTHITNANTTSAYTDSHMYTHMYAHMYTRMHTNNKMPLDSSLIPDLKWSDFIGCAPAPGSKKAPQQITKRGGQCAYMRMYII